MKTKHLLLFYFFLSSIPLFCQMNVSDLEVSADLKYVTVGINGTNLIQGDVSDPFTAQDQGKLIAIKKAFHNGPTYLESLEYTNPGRIVTATATIDTVYEATNEALIAFEGLFYDNVSHPNGWQLTETGTARAYVYTNNYIALQEAMDSCYSAQVEFLDLDLNGVIGINPIYNRTNENRALLFDGLSGNLTLRNVANSRLKLCTEFIGTNLPAEGLDIGLAENYTLISRHALFSDRNNRNGTPTNVSVIHGNSSVLVSCVPPDLAGTPWRHFSPAIFNGTLRAPSNAIIRDLTLDGIGWSATDVDGNDSFWRTVYVNSGYGATQQLNSDPAPGAQVWQRTFIKNSDLQSVVGFVQFSNNYNTSAVHLDNVHLTKISNYTDENGRDGNFFEDGSVVVTDTTGVAPDYFPDYDYDNDKFSYPGQWRFYGLDIEVIGDTLRVLSDTDFSFYDYPFDEGAFGKVNINMAMDYDDGQLPPLNSSLPPILSQNPLQTKFHGYNEIVDARTVIIGHLPGDVEDGVHVEPIPSGTYLGQDIEINYLKGDVLTGGSGFGGYKTQKAEHAVYMHPHVSTDFDDFAVTSWRWDGVVRFFSGGGIDTSNTGELVAPPLFKNFTDCDFSGCQGLEYDGYQRQGEVAGGYNPMLDPVHVKAENSILKSGGPFYVGTLELTNSTTLPCGEHACSTFNCNILISNGGNDIGHLGTVFSSGDGRMDNNPSDEPDNDNSFVSVGDTWRMISNGFRFRADDLYLLLDSSIILKGDSTLPAFLPWNHSGTTHIKDNLFGEETVLAHQRYLGKYFPYAPNGLPSPINADVRLIFERVDFNGNPPLKAAGGFSTDRFFMGNLNSLYTGSEPFYNMDLEIRDHLRFNNLYGNYYWPIPSFDSNSKYVGIMPVTTEDNSDTELAYFRQGVTIARKRPFHLGTSELYFLGVNVSQSNTFDLDSDMRVNFISADFRRWKEVGNDILAYSWSMNPYMRAGDQVHFDIASDAQVSFDPFRLGSSRTLSNIVVKHIDRIPGERVTFEFDPRQGRLIEVDDPSIPDEAYTIPSADLADGLPTRPGMKDELLFNQEDPSIGYQFIVEHDTLSDNLFTIQLPHETYAVFDSGGEPAELYKIRDENDSLVYFSIGQEFTDGRPLVNLSFSLIDSNNVAHLFQAAPEFTRRQTPESKGDNEKLLNTMHPDFVRTWWTFSHTDTAGVEYKAYMKNRIGELHVFGVLPFNLKATDNVLFHSGLRVTDEHWEIKSKCENETRWDGTTWSHGTPDSTFVAIIEGPYSAISNGEFTSCSLELSDAPNASMTIEEGMTITVINDLTNLNVDTAFRVMDKGSLVMIEDDGLVSGDFLVEKRWAPHLFDSNLSPGVNSDKFSIWGTPLIFGEQSINQTFSNNAISYHWETSLPEEAFDQYGGSEYFAPGEGYYLRQNDGANFDYNTPLRFKGTVNNGEVKVPVYFDPTPETDNDNSEFFSNPYPSAIDWFKFKEDNNQVVQGALYFWKQVFPTTVGIQGPQWVTVNDVGAVPADSANGMISTAQGFSTFISQGDSVIFKNSQRIIGGNNQSFRSTAENDGRIWVQMDGGDISAQILIGFDDQFSDDFNTNHDAKFINSAASLQLFTLIDGQRVAIQGLAPLTAVDRIIPIGYIPIAGEHHVIQIAKDELNDRYGVFLEDTADSVFTNLQVSDYHFVSTNNNENLTRFRLHIRYNCIGDFDADSDVDVDDFLMLNSAFGSDCIGCPTDMDRNGTINIGDFVMFNSHYGTICD